MSDYQGLPDWIKKAAEEIYAAAGFIYWSDHRSDNVKKVAEVIARNVQPSPDERISTLEEALRTIIAICSPNPKTGHHRRLSQIFGELLDIAEPALHPEIYAEARPVQQPAPWMPQSIPLPPSPKTEARIANLTPEEILQGEVWINGAFLCRLDDFIRVTVQGEP